MTGATGAGRGGASPYNPGENEILEWIRGGTLGHALQREEGSMRPVLIYLYRSDMNENCCAANFERALFRYQPTVRAFARFACYKIESRTVKEKGLLEQFDLRSDKPALLLLDAEGGLLHKQQLCVDPKKFLRVISSSVRLSDLRVRLKSSQLAQRTKAQKLVDEDRFNDALRIYERLGRKPEALGGHVERLVTNDLNEIEEIAHNLLAEAGQMHEERKLLQSYRLYREIEKEFSRLAEASMQAKRHARALSGELRRLGVGLR
ncbi:MAG TPA: hypothetical protein EYN79_08040 [Planctomycetes bacterium]|nr:hypothetical protein [Planctomycetota bacterium]HIN80315.1 hypothetical protein [Planctomycetota bacterium]